MSAESNVEAITGFHDAMEVGDRDALGELFDVTAHAECEWVPLVVEVEGQSYRGREGVRAFFDDFLDSFEVRYENRELRAVGEGAVLILCQAALRGRESGAELVQEMGVLYEFEDGLLRRGRAYPSHAAAISAAAALARGEEVST